MNKIFIDKEKKDIVLEDNIVIEDKKIIINDSIVLDVNIKNTNLDYTIYINNSNVTINILGEDTNNKINYILNNSELLVQKLVVNNSDNITINLDSVKSKVTYRYSSINYSSNSYSIDIYHNSPNTDSLVVNHGVNVEDNSLDFNVCGYIYKDSINCTCNQDNKIINLKNSKSLIRPKLIIDNNMIEANHSAYIGSFKDNELFYLMSRGLSKKKSYDLLLKAYLIGEFNIKDNDLYLEKIKSIGGE